MKKFLSLVLAITLAVSGFACVMLSASAEDTQSPEYNGNPVIVVSGMAFTELYENFDSEDRSPAIKPVTAGYILSAVGKGLGAMIKSFSFDAFVEVGIETADEILGKLSCDADGNSLYNVSTYSYPEPAASYEKLNKKSGSNEEALTSSCIDAYGEDNVYFFFYDWRLDPLSNCDDLSDMIDSALEATGKSKVKIVCNSMGGTQTLAYIYKHGADKLESVVFNSSTVYGNLVASDLFNGNVEINADALYNFMLEFLAKNGMSKFAVNALYKIGLIRYVSKLANKFTDKYKEQVFDETLINIFGTMPGFWALVQPYEYESAMEYMFSGKEEEYAGIIAKADALYEMNSQRKQILANAMDAGVKISFIANYDRQNKPVYKSAIQQGDGTLETATMATGATVSDVGKQLSEEYLKDKNMSFVSPDRCIDASTSDFRDYTWFVKGAPHVACAYGSDYTEFVLWLLDSENQPTINSDTIYPQFMISPDRAGIELTH